MTELEQLTATPQALQIAGENLLISPLKVGQLPTFLRALQPLLTHFGGTEIDWLGLLAERGDDLLCALAVACKKPIEWVQDLSADEALLLAAKVVEVNADFFTRTVLPQLHGLMQRLPAQAAQSTGSTSSKV